VVDRSVAEASAFAAGAAPTAPLTQLSELLSTLPEERRHLPLLISVGRMHRVKGVATMVDAWASGTLRDRANLLIVGGNLAEPSRDESEQLDLINARIEPSERERSGLLLAGHQPNDTVARWVAAARFGVPGLAAPAGVYVCGSLKEEFGIALLEAMASGLMVVAPNGGGPATYVRDGVTGFLTTTSDPAQLGSAIAAALDAVAAESSADRTDLSRATVADNFTIEAMAYALHTVYATVAATEQTPPRAARQDWAVAAR
jgi:glycosyltransferase involved in cell wall biosynthesis